MDFQADTIPADTQSTVIDTEAGPSASGGGQVAISETPDAKSAREDLEAVFKADAKKAEPKPEVPAKDEPNDEAKPAEKAAEVPERPAESETKPEVKGEDTDKPKEAEKTPEPKDAERDKSRYPEPPAKFLPDAKEHWRNTPRTVQREVATMVADHEREIGQYRQSHERYESVRRFDEMAQQHNTTLPEALERYVGMEQALRGDPVTGFRALLDNMGIQPQQAVSYILGASGVSPEALAQHIVQNPQAYVAQAQPQQQQVPQREDPRIEQLQQQLAQMQERQLEDTVIKPFVSDHPRYHELEQDIAFFLQSGRIPSSLSAIERLEVAYDMADRLNPASRVTHPEAEERLEPDLDRRADLSFSGSKSIKSAPGSVTEEVADEAPGGESIRDTLRKEMRRLNR